MRKFVDFKNGLIASLSDKHEWMANHFTDLFHTPWPYVFILAVSLLTMLSIWKGDKRTGFWGHLMATLFFAFPVAMLLMEIALLTLGKMGSVWWCDPYRMGFWHALMRLLIFLVFLIAQWVAAATYFYNLKQETDDNNNNNEKWASIEFLTLFLCLLAFYPLSSWLIFHLGNWIHLPSIVCIVLWMLIPIGGLLYSWIVNTGSFGFGRGFLFTVFSICVAVGLLAGLCILLQAIKVFYWYMAVSLVIVFAFAVIIFMAMAYNEKDGGSLSDGTRVIFYWFENPGCLGFIIAAVIAYLILHFWLKVF